MNQEQQATRFAELHVEGSPLVLYNAWDTGSAKAIVEAGAKAIATSSWAIAEAHGYRDGESIPLALAEQIVARIVETVDVPVTMDFEGGYSDDDGQLAKNLSRVLAHGIVGINFEDRVVKGTGLYSIDWQAARIAALRGAADRAGVRLFINARTDLFLGQPGDPADSVDEAVQRAKAYASAGASGFFIPGLKDNALIRKICESSPLPVNVLVLDGVSPNKRLAELGVARISHGSGAYIAAMKAVGAQAAAAFA